MIRRLSAPLTRLAPLALAAVLAGCAGFGAPPRDLARLDLGLQEPVSISAAARPTGVEVRAPSWLTTSAQQYRLTYADALQRQAYTETRWAAPPAEMLTRALEQALQPAGETQGHCRLRVELDEFIQVFESPASSHQLLAARAMLLPQRGETPLAGRDLQLRVPADSADARGGALAARAAVGRLTAELGNWLEGLDPKAIGRLNGGMACRP
ncbi:hypothetical protein E6C76_04535 [Pseudothauera nasutitermitis]|uniref:ABC-type transport auxiliary lipoprotein component domain-containing protein n=1 Tax=Pseudothauera nasutitermitis TaxID=2565930 RepID=A0A4S4B129_9RHOO|nr:ABC-type transport auxiliary lipoprotein family protein [Pseudothauera nasutitermitis]THF66129.1 hypothetical protein E6C76_04535 [Pseudothauera nasutitermitis]